MNTLFDFEVVEPVKEAVLFPDKKCRECRHIKNLNPYSNRYWYCMITPCKRTPYGFKAVKRMNVACNKYEPK